MKSKASSRYGEGGAKGGGKGGGNGGAQKFASTKGNAPVVLYKRTRTPTNSTPPTGTTPTPPKHGSPTNPW